MKTRTLFVSGLAAAALALTLTACDEEIYFNPQDFCAAHEGVKSAQYSGGGWARRRFEVLCNDGEFGVNEE